MVVSLGSMSCSHCLGTSSISAKHCNDGSRPVYNPSFPYTLYAVTPHILHTFPNTTIYCVFTFEKRKQTMV